MNTTADEWLEQMAAGNGIQIDHNYCYQFSYSAGEASFTASFTNNITFLTFVIDYCRRNDCIVRVVSERFITAQSKRRNIPRPLQQRG